MTTPLLSVENLSIAYKEGDQHNRVTHEVSFTPGSRTAALMGDDRSVHCFHHQGVADPGTLTVAGRAEDGLIEALEDPARRFLLAVQWHPEVIRDKRLFGALVTATR